MQYHHFIYDTAQIEDNVLTVTYVEDDEGEHVAVFTIVLDHLIGYQVHTPDDNYAITLLLPSHTVMLTTDEFHEYTDVARELARAVRPS